MEKTKVELAAEYAEWRARNPYLVAVGLALVDLIPKVYGGNAEAIPSSSRHTAEQTPSEPQTS
jgi:hypothetical protein